MRSKGSLGGKSVYAPRCRGEPKWKFWFKYHIEVGERADRGSPGDRRLILVVMLE